MPRRAKLERAERAQRRAAVDGASRVLVVDDHPDAVHLLGKVIRRAGFEVAELSDPASAVAALLDEPGPVGALVASFTTAGTRACLRLLDSIRNHPDPRLSDLRVLLVSDHTRQQIFCFQAGADAIVLRPYYSDDLISELTSMIARPERDRRDYRAAQIERLKANTSHPLDPRHTPMVSGAAAG